MIRPIHSGVLIRAGEPPGPAAEAFVRFLPHSCTT